MLSAVLIVSHRGQSVPNSFCCSLIELPGPSHPFQLPSLVNVNVHTRYMTVCVSDSSSSWPTRTSAFLLPCFVVVYARVTTEDGSQSRERPTRRKALGEFHLTAHGPVMSCRSGEDDAGPLADATPPAGLATSDARVLQQTFSLPCNTPCKHPSPNSPVVDRPVAIENDQIFVVETVDPFIGFLATTCVGIDVAFFLSVATTDGGRGRRRQ